MTDNFNLKNHLSAVRNAILSSTCPRIFSTSLQSEKSSKYPHSKEGFAVSFDPLTESNELLAHFYEYGLVVCKQVLTSFQVQQAHNRALLIHTLYANAQDREKTPLASRGFLDIYHDNSLCQIRQSPKIHAAYALIWGQVELWTSFDRFGVKTNQGESSIGLGLHVDQNVTVHPGFTTLQGVLALSDSRNENGTFLAVPRSNACFEQYTEFVKPGYKGEFVNLPETSTLWSKLKSLEQPIALKSGDLVIWDSRLTHANTSNVSATPRVVCYVAAGVAKDNMPHLIEERLAAFKQGYGINKRDAYLHASKKPRFNDLAFLNDIREKEEFTELGLKLYSLRPWDA